MGSSMIFNVNWKCKQPTINSISITANRKVLSQEQNKGLFGIQQIRFEKNMHRHTSSNRGKVLNRTENNPTKIQPLNQMEVTGEEPDIITCGKDECHYHDCSKQSTSGRRSICYHVEARELR